MNRRCKTRRSCCEAGVTKAPTHQRRRPRRAAVAEDICIGYLHRHYSSGYWVSLGGLAWSNFSESSAIPAATLRPFWPSTETG